MNYSYNYKFLSQFMEGHKLAKKDLLEALGCNDYVSLNKWLEGKIPVHVTAMLRFCNYYNVPLANFFCDEDGLPCDFNPCQPDESAQLLPTDGYGMREGRGRGIVETRIVGERAVSTQAQKSAVDEGLQRRDEQLRRREAAINNKGVEGEGEAAAPKSALPELPEILRVRLECSEKIRRVHEKCFAEFERLHKIIEHVAKIDYCY